eukprot:759076-Hanusia_phi.AAC.5
MHSNFEGSLQHQNRHRLKQGMCRISAYLEGFLAFFSSSASPPKLDAPPVAHRARGPYPHASRSIG